MKHYNSSTLILYLVLLIIKSSFSYDQVFLSNGTLGEYIKIVGYRMGWSKFYTEMRTTSECHCKLLCYTEDRCVSFTNIEYEWHSSCLLSDKNFQEASLRYERQSTTFFWTKYDPTVFYDYSEDTKQMYMISSEKMTFTKATEFCNSPYRFAATDLEKHKAILDRMADLVGSEGAIMVNLSIKKGKLQWCNKVKWSDSAIEAITNITQGDDNNDVYVYRDGMFEAKPADHKDFILCQEQTDPPDSGC